jgi:uncharacterized membrane protein YebE (DUF533 family)
MNIQNLLNQFTGSTANKASTHNINSSILNSCLMGGAAGRVIGLLVGSKKGRQFAGKAATMGGAALLLKRIKIGSTITSCLLYSTQHRHLII